MKNYIITILLSAGLWMGCTDDAINLDPKDSIPYEMAFESIDRCELSIVGCYDAAQSGYYPGNDQRRGYPFGAASTQQGDLKGEDMVNVQQFFAVTYGGTYSVSSPNGQAHWECTFQMINKINIVIEGLKMAAEQGIISERKALDGEAELRFLRALGLHEILVFFCSPYAATADASHYGSPVSLIPINSLESVGNAIADGRKTVKETYDQIIADLDFAEANLITNSSDITVSIPEADGKVYRNTSNIISRASKGAAISLKTRVYQHMGNWSKVVEESSKLVGSSAPFQSSIGGYMLTEQPEGPFANNSSNTESIFSIENGVLDNCTNNGSLSQFYHTVRGLVCVSPIIVNADFWLEEDLRREQLLDSEPYANVPTYWSWKYRTGTVMDDWTPIIRYAEVLLNYAEAEARVNGVTQRAVDLLNAVRNRAVLDGEKRYTLSSFTNVDALMNAILNERRIEFLAEGRRWPDIHRLTYDKYAVKDANGNPGVPNKVLHESMNDNSYQPASGNIDPNILKVAGFDYTDRRYIFPIPLSEITSNPTIAQQQNPGW